MISLKLESLSLKLESLFKTLESLLIPENDIFEVGIIVQNLGWHAERNEG